MSSFEEYTPSALSEDPDYSPPPALRLLKNLEDDIEVLPMTPTPKFDQVPLVSSKEQKEYTEELFDEAYDLIKDLNLSMKAWGKWNSEYNQILKDAIHAKTNSQVLDNNARYQKLLDELNKSVNIWRKISQDY